MRSSSLYWIILTSIALLLLCVSYLPGVRSATQSLYRLKEQQRASILSAFFNDYASIGFQTSKSQLQQRLSILERENRILFSALATVSAQRGNSPVATGSARRSDSSQSGQLSRDLSGWFVIQDIPEMTAAQTLVYQQGVVIGEVSATSSGVLPLSLVSKRSAPLLVVHQPTTLVGTLTIQGQTPKVEFFQRVEGINVGDLFTTLPTRNREPAAAIGKVESVETQPSDPVSVIKLLFIANPTVGERVEVGR